jgi:hypothetical protein
MPNKRRLTNCCLARCSAPGVNDIFIFKLPPAEPPDADRPARSDGYKGTKLMITRVHEHMSREAQFERCALPCFGGLLDERTTQTHLRSFDRNAGSGTSRCRLLHSRLTTIFSR